MSVHCTAKCDHRDRVTIGGRFTQRMRTWTRFRMKCALALTHRPSSVLYAMEHVKVKLKGDAMTFARTGSERRKMACARMERDLALWERGELRFLRNGIVNGICGKRWGWNIALIAGRLQCTGRSWRFKTFARKKFVSKLSSVLLQVS